MIITSILLLTNSSAVAIRRDKSITYARSSITVLILCIIISLNNFDYKFLEKDLGLFHASFHGTGVSHVFQAFMFIISVLILQLNGFYPRKVWMEKFSSLYNLVFCKLNYYNNSILNKMAGQFRVIEYPLIILFVIVGGTFLVSCCNLISIFLSIELQSYGLYILCTVYRDSEKATSAGLTYFLLGGLSSCFILLASSLIYSNSGDTSFDGMYIIGNISAVSDVTNNTDLFLYKSYFVNFSLIVMSIGFLFKIAAAPFHFWSPDVYDSIPTIVTTFVAIFAKISILVLFLQLIHCTYNNELFSKENNLENNLENNVKNNVENSIKSNQKTLNVPWTFSLLISSFLSLIIGSVLGLTQLRVKKLYAYSTISHIGFILLALCINSIESIQSFIFYLIQYSISNLNAFIILITIGFSLYMYIEEKNPKGLNDNLLATKMSDKTNSPLQLVSQLKGYFHINPVLAISLVVTLFSFVGIPPLIGFFAKQMVLTSALDNGYVFITFIAILTSVISAYYYLGLIRQMFFQKSNYIINTQLNNIKGTIVNIINNNLLHNVNITDRDITLSGCLAIVISFLSLIILLFILNPQEWLSVANILALNLYNR
uniref:NADH-ubiquinone oxidoreductase chain 2 n=1 Tax=Opegrapha vulgata TaxID=543791 RepID=A0A286QSH4_9PEZI|nr:NADH dehydrogenase subunit 2 [Opegrapha vulgata]ASB29426.1 NADH dehydrogenase subunit 2 [Opegrapha vulgata]